MKKINTDELLLCELQATTFENSIAKGLLLDEESELQRQYEIFRRIRKTPLKKIDAQRYLYPKL